MRSEEEFITFIDDLVPDSIIELLRSEFEGTTNLLDLINLQEKARVLTIKEKISSTHHWTKATVVDQDTGIRTECFWCNKCDARCSTFEHINCLSIISKVKDNLPTYTVHNSYLQFSCDEIANIMKPGNTGKHCYDCGMPEKATGLKCNLVDYE